MYFFVRYFTLDFVMDKEQEIHPAIGGLMVGLGLFMLCRNLVMYVTCYRSTGGNPNKVDQVRINYARKRDRETKNWHDLKLLTEKDVSIIKSLVSDNSLLQKIDKDNAELFKMTERTDYCEKCCIIKPVRAHHCNTCGKCCLKMDHHCLFLHNCIGLNNLRYFI
jgi:hypothetical protein